MARVLSFDPLPITESSDEVPTFSVPVAPSKGKRAKKVATVEADMLIRRSTRQSAKTKGFRHAELSYTPVKKKPRRSKRVIAEEEQLKEGQGQQTGNSEDAPTTPYTPIQTLQQVGRTLQIPEEELTEDKLEACPNEELPKKSSDE